MIADAEGGEWIVGLDGSRYIVLERYPDLPLTVVDLSNGHMI